MNYSKRRKRKNQKNRVGKVCVSFTVLFLVMILSVQILHLYHKNQTYKAQQEQLQAQLEEQQERAKQLKEKEDYVGSQEYIEDIAKSKLGMTYDNEIVFKEK
ncbi:Protein required for the initiation of cell division [uncultured Roseburia sp.]|uniref:Cell division protein FtsL n=1 Tax=Brotonthovivens ammoniilytica TaxID=2981725 RepID=A0ABT2TL39_9FIRM|nr:cell division protein FtsL [Brotonthovivens ammoniilytica]MCU6762919.1 cell division protein FtsL [Brotonthovivens ammoniilytica]SCI93846.1 Protein required for the initiation of cell division [uncultured Roseburia sp.]